MSVPARSSAAVTRPFTFTAPDAHVPSPRVTMQRQRWLLAVDAVVAVVLCAMWTWESAHDPGDGPAARVALYALAAVATLPFAVRRLAPRTVFAVLAVAFAAALVIGSAGTGVGVALAAYTVLVDHDRRTGLVVIATGYLLIVLAFLVLPGTLSNLFFDAITFAMLIAIAELVRTRRAYARIYAERAAQLDRDRVALAQQAVAEERLRIARELHDVVAHSISLIAVQSSVGLDRIRADPVAAEHALDTIETNSRSALAEMQRMLGMLRPESGRMVELIPPPSLDGLSRLAEEAEEAGVPTTIQVNGARPSVVPPGLDLCAYRIVQEALTNVIKHAPDAQAQVSVTWHVEGLTVEVTDNGAGLGLLGEASTSRSPGHGLVGMRERVTLFGGQLLAGPRPSGGFGVIARLPFPTKTRTPGDSVPNGLVAEEVHEV